MDTAYLTNEQR